MDIYKGKGTKIPNIGDEIPKKHQTKAHRIRNATVGTELNLEVLEENLDLAVI